MPVPHSQTANEWQGGLFHDPSSEHHFYTTLAKKTRLPTLKDRYSQRLGTFIQNPGLRAENAVNVEVGYKGTLAPHSFLEMALFFNDITHKIQTVANVVGTHSQVQNVDKVRIYGTEVGYKNSVLPKLDVGGNYTYTYIKNLQDNVTKITDIPRHKAFLNVTYKPIPTWGLTPYVEYNGRRWASNTKELPGFTTLNFKTNYAFSKLATIDAGVTNILDRNYRLQDGFPSAGRQWFANLSFEI